MRKLVQTSRWKKIALNYIKNNSKEYILVILIFFIGLFIGVMFINNYSEEKVTNVEEYISNFIQKFNGIEHLDKKELVISSIKNNLLLTLIIWIAGTTIIGLPIVLGVILFRGFCLGYTISAVTYTLGIGKGILFCIITLFLQNIFFLPALLTLGVSSIKLYKSIIKDKRKENIKLEIIRHTIISTIMLVLLLISAFIENDISVMLLKIFIKYFVR